MLSKYRLIVFGAALSVLVLAGFASPAALTNTPETSALASPGHWEVVRQIEYYNLPDEAMSGDIPLHYRVYMVSLAGFHTETFGIGIGPNDDVRYTRDGGQSWVRATGELYCRHGLDIVDEQVAWHCGNGGTRVSTNGGQSWQTVTPSPCPSLSFLDAQTGWAASSTRLLVTTSGGADWNEILLPVETQKIAAVALRTENDGYMLDTSGSLFVTADSGQSWEVRSLGLEPGEHLLTTSVGPYAALRFLDAQHGMVVFSLADQTVWFAVTQDGGLSWQRAEIPELRGQAYYYHLYLSRDARLLTATDSFLNGENVSLVLRYQDS